MKNKIKNNDLEMYSFDQIKDEFIGEIGTEKRTRYEQELQLEVLGGLIKQVRVERNLTQEELGKLIGVQRAQISVEEKLLIPLLDKEKHWQNINDEEVFRQLKLLIGKEVIGK